ncbi:MAG TPA: hypothetical protein VMW69_09680 [Spirochaetia bacterium]|nr:hypothetical protein [Spirochaetia bacterium]
MPALRKRGILLFVLTACLSVGVGAENLTLLPTTISSARTSAIGGAHAALADDLTTLFSNPAGFYEVQPEIRLSEITMHLQGPIFDLAGVAAGGLSGNFAQLLGSSNVQNLLQSIYASMNLIGPISFGYVGKGLGFGIFNTTGVTFTNTAPFTIAFSAGEQLMLDGGWAFRIPLPQAWNSSLDAGVMMKSGLQGISYLQKSLFELPSLFNSIGLSTLTGAPFYFNTLIGLDAGLRYSYKDWFSVGIVGHDIYTPVLQSEYPTLQSFIDNSATPTKSNTVLPFNLSVGTLFTPDLGPLDLIISNFKLMLDYSNALDFLLYPATARNALLNMGLGTEITLLKILELRAGFHEGLFSAGLGLDLKYFRLDASMYGTELSSEPGLQPVFNMIVGFSFQI